jgi:DME family drug/metabolite transporter
MAESGRDAARGAALVLVVCAALWSLNGPLIKLADQAGVDGVTIACYRSLLGGFVFLPLAWRQQRKAPQPLPWKRLGFAVATFTLMTGSFVVANTLTAAANAILLQYTAPLWVFLLSPLLLKETPHRRDALILAVSLVGIFVIFAGNASTDLPGLLLGLTSGVGFGLLTIQLRGLRDVRPLTVAAANALGSGLLLLPLAAIWGVLLLNGQQWALLLTLALVQFTLPYVLYSWALQRIAAHRAALIILFEAVLNPLWTWLLVAEVPPMATFVGGPLILAGIAWRLLTTLRSVRPPPAP